MNPLRLLCLPAALLLLFPFCSESQAFRWSRYLHDQVIITYGDSSRYIYRRAQVRAESGDNPRATSDYRGWKKQGIDTVAAVMRNMGAAGLCQFIWPTGQRYGAISVTTSAATDTIFANDLYNPFWSLRSMCRYMSNIEHLLKASANPKARRKLMRDTRFAELCSSAGYNWGEGRLLKLLKKYSTWEEIYPRLPKETQLYTDRITRIVR